MLNKIICYFKGHLRRRRWKMDAQDADEYLRCPRCGDLKPVKAKAAAA